MLARMTEDFFAAKLRHETDPSDVAAARAAGERLVLVDVRDDVAWAQGHIPGAIHLPRAQIPSRLDDLPSVADDPNLVVYCWGPGCNGSTKAALALTRAGYRRVREMIGGFEYWAREGLAIESAAGRSRRPVDELTAPVRASRTSDVAATRPGSLPTLPAARTR
jgi:rhodanese-related sulfurtransferase